MNVIPVPAEHRHHSFLDAIYLININLRPRAEKENSEKPTEGPTLKRSWTILG